MIATDIMTSPVHTIRVEASLEQAARMMLEHKVGCLPVVDAGGVIAGILTESDFAAKEKGIPFSLYRFPQVFGDWLPKQGVERMYAAARSRAVGEFMSRPAVTVRADEDLEGVLTTMLETGFHRIPVVVEGKPVGIIARHDLLRLMVSQKPL